MTLLSIKHIRTNTYTHDHEEVPEGTPYGFWRIVEHTKAGWFPWPPRYRYKEAAETALSRLKTPRRRD